MAGCAMALGAFAAEETVLFEGDYVLTWDFGETLEITAEKMSSLIAGDKLVFTVSQMDEIKFDEDGKQLNWPQIVVRDNSDSKNLLNQGLWSIKDATPFTVAIDVPYNNFPESIAEILKEGMHVDGEGATISKIAINHTGDASLTIPAGTAWMNPEGWQVQWGTPLDLGKEVASLLEAGQYLNFTVTQLLPDVDPYPQLKIQAEWSGALGDIQLHSDNIEGLTLPFVKSYQLTEENIETLNDKPLYICGTAAVITAVTVSDESQETEPEPDGPSAVNTIAVEKEELSVYNLQGVKMNVKNVNELGKGIYVVNGKKVMVK